VTRTDELPAASSQPPPFPGVPSINDGTGAVVWVETHISQAACAYPITPSTNMGVAYAEAVANGRCNLWGERLAFLEPESEHSSASATEGFAVAGGRATNFTSGQGLVLMKEVLYTISGKRLPVVLNIGARALTSQALNVHAGHDDVMAVADTGWGMLFARNAQGAADLCLIARRTAETAHTPFMNIQDGFLTTHTLESVRLPEPAFMRDFIGAPGAHLLNLMDPKHPIQSGVVQNQDAYMKGKIAQRYFYDQVEPALIAAMDELAAQTGRRYGLIEPYRMEDAPYAIVAMGSMAETAMATVDYIRGATGLRCGVVHVTSFRPFPGPQLVAALAHCKAVAVLERMDNPLAQSNPLTAELKSAFADALTGHPSYDRVHRIPDIYSGAAGLGSRDIRPGDLIAVLTNMVEHGRRYFVLGIRHELALESQVDPDIRPAGSFSMRGYSIGGYGSVSTNKAIATIAGELFGLQVQAYPLYGSEKKGLPTTYYLTAAPERIRTHCELDHVDFVPLNNVNAFNLGNPLLGISDGGTLFVQSAKTAPEAVWNDIPTYAKRIIRRRHVRVLYLDAAGIAAAVSTRPDLQVRMQGIVLLGIFLRCTPYLQRLQLSSQALFEKVEVAIRHYFARAGEQVVLDNMTCVRRGFAEVQEVPRQVILRDVERETLALQGKSVREAMVTSVVTCHPDTPLPDVIATMQDRGISAIVVVDRDGGALRGVLSSTDLRHAHITQSELETHLPELLPSHLMAREVITTWPEESLEAAAQKLFEHHIHRLVVTPSAGEHTPIGILSMTDLVALSEKGTAA